MQQHLMEGDRRRSWWTGAKCTVMVMATAGCGAPVVHPGPATPQPRLAPPQQSGNLRNNVPEVPSSSVMDEPSQSRSRPARYHEVQQGETLSSIARQYGVSVQEIVEANGLDDPDHIQPGQSLYIPRNR